MTTSTIMNFPHEVWVVIGAQQGTEFVVTHRQGAMEHALECSEVSPELGPWRVARYVLSPERI